MIDLNMSMTWLWIEYDLTISQLRLSIGRVQIDFGWKWLEYDLTMKKENKSDYDLNMNDYSQIYDYNLITLRLITQLWV